MRRSTITWIVSLASTAPFFYLLWLTLDSRLGAQPAEKLNREFGEVTLILLVTNLYFGVLMAFWKPLPGLLRWIPAARRPLGVAAFCYLVFHVGFHFVKEGDLAAGFAEIAKRVYLMAGAGAFTILFTMALTSSDRAVRWMGFRRWKRLHRLVHLATVLLVFHRTLIEKADLIEAALYFAPLLALQGVRAVRHLLSLRRAAPAALAIAAALSPSAALAAPGKTWEGSWWSEEAKIGLVLVARASVSAEDRVTGFVAGLPEARVLGGAAASKAAVTVRLEMGDGGSGRRRIGCAALALALSKDGGALVARAVAPLPGSRCRAIVGFGEGLKFRRAREDSTAESWKLRLGAIDAEAAIVRDAEGRLLGGKVRASGACGPEGCGLEIKAWKAQASGLLAELRGENETHAERCLSAPWNGRTRSFGPGCLFVKPEKGCGAPGAPPPECGESARAWKLSYAPLSTVARAARLAGRVADALEPGKFDAFAPLLSEEFRHDGKGRGVAAITWRNRVAGPVSRVAIDGILRVGGPGEDPRSSRSLSPGGSWMEWRASVHSGPAPRFEISVSPGADDAFLWLEESDGRFLFSGNGARAPLVLELPGAGEDEGAEAGSFLLSDLPRRWLERTRSFGAPTPDGPSTGWGLTLKPELPAFPSSAGVVDRVAWNCAHGRFEVRIAHRGGALYTEYRNLSSLDPRWVADPGRGPGDCGAKVPDQPDQPPCDDEGFRSGCPVQRGDAIGKLAEAERLELAVLDADRRPVCPARALTDAEGYQGLAAAAAIGDRGEAGPESFVLPWACNDSPLEAPRAWRLRESKGSGFPPYVRVTAKAERGCSGPGTRCYSYAWESWNEKEGGFGKASAFRVLESQGEGAGWYQPLDFGDAPGPAGSPSLRGLAGRVSGSFSREGPVLHLKGGDQGGEKGGNLSATYEPLSAAPLRDVPVRAPGPFTRVVAAGDLILLGNPAFDGGRGNVVIVSAKAPGQPLACLSGVSPGARFGEAVGAVGRDFFVGAPGEAGGEGRVYVLNGAPLAEPPAAPAAISLLACIPPSADVTVLAPPEGRAGEAFGTSATAMGDLNGDGREELAVGSPGYPGEGTAGRVTIWSGTAVARTHLGRTPGLRFGHALAAAGDLDGDGATELVVGAPAAPLPAPPVTAAPAAALETAAAAAPEPEDEPAPPAAPRGQVLVLSGALKAPDGTIASLEGGGPGFGGQVAGGGDHDGDGVPDVAAADPDRAEALVYSGRTGGRIAASRAAGIAGSLADFNGDGLADLALIEPEGDGREERLVILGPGRELFALRAAKGRPIGGAALLRASIAVIEDGRLRIFAP